MWLKIINGKRKGYDTYKDACNNTNGYHVIYDGLFYIKLN